MQLQKAIDKYGSDVFQAISKDSLCYMINRCPAPDDEQWAALLCGSKESTRTAVLSQMNRLRRESISRAMEKASPASGHAILEMLRSAGIAEASILESPAEGGYSKSVGMNDAAVSALFSTPFDLFTANLDMVLSRWVLVVHVGSLLGLRALDPLLDADLDDASMALVRLAMRSPGARGFDDGVSSIRDTYLGEAERKGRAQSTALLAIATRKGVDAGLLKAELESLLGEPVGLPPTDGQWDWVVPDGRLTATMVQLLLLLFEKAKREGVLSLEPLLRLLSSTFLVEGIQLICDGIDVDELQHWLGAKRAFVMAEARRRFEVVASACWGLAAGCHRSFGRAILLSHTPYDGDHYVVRELIADWEAKVASIRMPAAPLSDCVHQASYGLVRADDSYADPLEWFELKAGLERLANNGILPGDVDFLAKLALVLPPHRWKELEDSSVLPGFEPAALFAYGFDLLQGGRGRLPVAPYLMNLVKNIGAEGSKLSGGAPELQRMLSRLDALEDTDALLLTADAFAALLDSLSAPQLNALAHSAFGQRALELGFPLYRTDGEVVDGGASRYALLAALAELVVREMWHEAEEGRERPAADWLVEKLEVDEDDFFSVNPATCFAYDPFYALLAVIGCSINPCSLEDGIDIFRRLPVKTVADMLCCGVNESNLGMINTLISSLSHEARKRLRERLALQCEDLCVEYDSALSWGFEEVLGLSDPYIREWLKSVSNEDLVLAFARVPQELVDRVLGNLTEAAANGIADDMQRVLSRLDPAEEARARIVIVQAAKAVDPECEARAAELEKLLSELH